MILQVISWPTICSKSAVSRTPLRDAGRNARTPTSTDRPPLITPVTTPAMVRFSANALSRADQSFGRSTLIFESR